MPPWIPPRPDESLPAYSARLAETIAWRPPVILAGVSLGGMVSCELARHVHPAAVVSIASCRSGRCVGLRLPGTRWCAARLPLGVWRVAQRLAFWAVSSSRPALSCRRDCIAMFRDADRRFMQWALRAIVEWDPVPLDDVPVWHIHGGARSADPPGRVMPDEVVPRGGHLINLTHAAEVNLVPRSCDRAGMWRTAGAVARLSPAWHNRRI